MKGFALPRYALTFAQQIYADELRLLAEPAPKVKQVRAESQKAEDYYKTFRTNVLLAWVLSNGLLAGIIL